MILYFLRHGRAQEPRDGLADDERRLTGAGIAQLRAAAPLWQRLNLRPDVVLASPLPRAMHTAALLAEALALADEPIPDARLSPGASWHDFAQSIARHANARRVLFVGHEPDLSNVVELLSGAAAVRMRPAGLACLEFPGVPEAGAGEIAWLLDPDLYAPRDD